MILKLFTGLSPFLEKIGTEPYLFEVSLVRILSQNLLYSYLSLGRAVDSQPYYAETSSSEKSDPSEVFGEAFSKLVVLFCGEVGSDVK